MHLLYLDESGLHQSPYFVLAGLAVYETQTHPLSTTVDQLLSDYLPEDVQSEPLRATQIRSGAKPPWDQLRQARRWSLLDEAYEVIRNSHAVLFGVAVEREWLSTGENEYLYALESIARRFDGYLRRLYRLQSDPQRGIINYRRRITVSPADRGACATDSTTRHPLGRSMESLGSAVVHLGC